MYQVQSYLAGSIGDTNSRKGYFHRTISCFLIRPYYRLFASENVFCLNWKWTINKHSPVNSLKKTSTLLRLEELTHLAVSIHWEWYSERSEAVCFLGWSSSCSAVPVGGKRTLISETPINNLPDELIVYILRTNCF